MSSPFTFVPLADPRDTEAFRPLGTPVPAPEAAAPTNEPASAPEPDPATVLARAVEDALARGRSEGHAEGMAAVAAERAALRNTAALLDEALQGLGTLHGQVAANAEQDCLALALAMAGRIVHAELAAHPERWVDIVRHALAKVGCRERVVVRVPPAVAVVLGAHRDALGVEPGTTVGIEADPALAPGTCLVETTQGDVDASLATQLERLADGLLGGAA